MVYILLLLALIASELIYFKLADHFNIIDKPNERSSHTKVTIRGGGVIFYIAVIHYFLLEGFLYPWFVMGLTCITLISFADDIRPLSAKLRLPVHFIAMSLMFYQWGLFSNSWYFTLIALVLCTGILNAFNFMDGINGITGVYSLVVVGALLYINLFRVHFVDTDFIVAVILALLVFNFFNFRTKAKCFAGDVGALSIAFIIVFFLGLLIIKTGNFSYIILLVVYGIDSVLTICHRIILRENIFHPHRKHAFQIMANELHIPHVLVTSLYASLQVMITIGYFLFKPFSNWFLVITICVLSFFYLAFTLKYYKLHVARG